MARRRRTQSASPSTGMPSRLWLVIALGAAALCLVVALLAYSLGAGQGGFPQSTASAVSIATNTPATEAGQTTVPEGMVAARVVGVVDGDTIEVEIAGRTYKLRYIGVDTPETKKPDTPVQPYGPEASAFNEQLVLGKTVYLEKDVSETDRYGRLLRYVWIRDDADNLIMVNEELVRQGYARISTFPPDVKYAERFLALEREARQANRGLWALATPEPTPSPEPAALCPQGCLTPPADCLIKGNISSDGRKVYHLPDSPYYERTKIEPDKGERWFCTPAEAEDAGWQAAGD